MVHKVKLKLQRNKKTIPRPKHSENTVRSTAAQALLKDLEAQAVTEPPPSLHQWVCPTTAAPQGHAGSSDRHWGP